MVPTEEQAKALWEKYRVPETKRIHLALVARVTMMLAERFRVDKKLLLAAALLHDIDKAQGGKHPERAVAILEKEGMNEVAEIVKTHSLHSILDPDGSPKSWEQKLLYLSDKMVKYDIVGVDQRFALWNAEHLPQKDQKILDACYPKVKQLEQEVFRLAHLSLDDILKKKEGIV